MKGKHSDIKRATNLEEIQSLFDEGKPFIILKDDGMNSRGDIVNQDGDYCYLPLIQCERVSGASSADQARALRSELCLKLWEEAK